MMPKHLTGLGLGGGGVVGGNAVGRPVSSVGGAPVC